MVLLTRLLLVLLFLFLSVCIALPAYTLDIRCGDVPVAFVYSAPEDIKCLCSTAKATIEFLNDIGIQTKDCITIRVVEKIPTIQKHALFGSCDKNTHEVFILKYLKAKELSKRGAQVFGTEITEELWCSFAAHELAHAISKNFLHPKIEAHTASEYISTVTQLAVLSPKTRELILERYSDVEAYKTREEMSEFYFLFDPNRFSVKSYLHFISLKEPRKFIDLLLREGNGY